MENPNGEVLLDNKKEWNIDTCYNINTMLNEISQSWRSQMVQIFLYEKSRIGKSLEGE